MDFSLKLHSLKIFHYSPTLALIYQFPLIDWWEGVVSLIYGKAVRTPSLSSICLMSFRSPDASKIWGPWSPERIPPKITLMSLIFFGVESMVRLVMLNLTDQSKKMCRTGIDWNLFCKPSWWQDCWTHDQDYSSSVIKKHCSNDRVILISSYLTCIPHVLCCCHLTSNAHKPRKFLPWQQMIDYATLRSAGKHNQRFIWISVFILY